MSDAQSRCSLLGMVEEALIAQRSETTEDVPPVNNQGDMYVCTWKHMPSREVNSGRVATVSRNGIQVTACAT